MATEPKSDAIKQVYLDAIAGLQRQVDIAGATAAQASEQLVAAKAWAQSANDHRDKLLARLADVERTFKVDFPNG